ncbi:hypothetical protein TELCIR_18675 [Teladorsagia circumcincta]|uniref:Protein arginine methyltransferase NDUFAF7 n=1 Tax=Teladorsagia circumcincta TaxID=45464 RepID=A0A2G9TPC2_TELCI|nr:hypothetical protein TELCIR_18675 [Teladorsagia circumcincta]
MLSAFSLLKEKNLSVHLVETSDALIRQQEETLCAVTLVGNAIKESKSKSGVPIFWYKTLDDVPEQFSVFVANEFLDALPVHQFCRESDGLWHEVYINIDKTGELCFMRSKGENLHTRIIHNGGFGLIIDYGHDGSRKDLSFRSYQKHEQVNPLSQPGATDLTADVNFGYLKSLIVDRAIVYGPNTQRDFLAQLGAQVRLRKLLKSCSDREKQEALIKSYNFLMGDMGERFLAMSIFPKTLSGILEKRGGPAGFAQNRSTASRNEKAN